MNIADGDLPWNPSGCAEFDAWHFYNHPLEGMMTDLEGNYWLFTVLEDDQENENDGHRSRWAYIPLTAQAKEILEQEMEGKIWVPLRQFLGNAVIIAEATDLRITRRERRQLREEDLDDGG